MDTNKMGGPGRGIAVARRGMGSWHIRVTASLLTLLMLSAVVPAVGAPLERENFVNSFEGVFDECGFPVRFAGEERINLLVNPRGPDGLAYFGVRVRGTVSLTHAEVVDGPVLSTEYSFHDRDSRVTDNGDGTLTILVSVSGRFTTYLDGERLFHDAGQIRFEVLIDHAGTPTDPSDDEVLAELGPVGSPVGRDDTGGRDFCEDLNQFLN